MTFSPSHPRPGGSSAQHSAPPTVTDATAPTFMAERSVAEAQRTAPRHLSKPAPQTHGPPPTGPDRRQDPPAASPPPYQPSMSAHIQRMPRYRRRRESQPNPEAGTVRAHPRVHIRSRPYSPRTPTAQDYEEYPGPPPPPDPTTPSHPPTPTTPPKTAAAPRDSGGSAGPTRSSGSCESGPGQSPPSRA